MEFTEKDGAIFFKAKVAPRSFRSEIVAESEGELKIKLKSPPFGGAANSELIRLLSKSFGVSKSRIHIVAGEASKNKL